MEINGLEVRGDLFPPKNKTLNGKREVFERKFGINGFSSISLHTKDGAKRETEALKRLCKEDRNLAKSYWWGRPRSPMCQAHRMRHPF